MVQWSPARAPLPPDWEVRRQYVFDRDKVCQLAYDGVCTVVPTECDHTGDRDDHRVDMLQAVCSECHQVKTQEQSRQGSKARAARAKLPKRIHPALR